MEEVRTASKTARRNRPATFFAVSARPSLTDPRPFAPPLANSQKSEAEIMREQEEKLKAKFGGLAPKKKLIHKDVKYFDSADYSMHKQKHEEAKVEEDLHQPSKLNSSPAKPN
jgi:hypothetical protein